MPIRLEDGQTPRGRPCLRIYTSGEVTLADSELLFARMGPGGDYNGKRAITLAAKDTSYTSEARKRLPQLRRQYLGMAVVVQSTIIRAAINLMVRFAGDSGDVRMFPGEDEAMAWLDSLD